jgi:hypothetical protein
VPQHVPADDAQAGAPTRVPERMLALVLSEHASGLVTEHKLASKVSVSFELIAYVAPETRPRETADSLAIHDLFGAALRTSSLPATRSMSSRHSGRSSSANASKLGTHHDASPETAGHHCA